jgi:hypothetical protein
MWPPTARATRPKSEHSDTVSVDPRTYSRATSLVRQRGTRASRCLCTSEPARALVRPRVRWSVVAARAKL